jgi:hypothetical protein
VGFDNTFVESALPPKADIEALTPNVLF